MSSEFKQFSEPARLYAQYLEVVEKMERIFVDDIVSFLDTVRVRMQAKLDAGQKVEEEETKEYRSWWIEDVDDKETNDDDYVPYVWLERKNEEIIIPGVLTLIADMNEATEAERHQLSACKSSLNLPANCKLSDRRLFTVSITYGDSDPVEAVSEPILAILQALHRVEKKIFAAREKKNRNERPKSKK